MLGYGDEVSTNPQLEEWMNYVHPEDHAIIAEAQAANARGEREAFSLSIDCGVKTGAGSGCSVPGWW